MRTRDALAERKAELDLSPLEVIAKRISEVEHLERLLRFSDSPKERARLRTRLRATRANLQSWSDHLDD